MPDTVRLTRRVYFSSGHRYWIPALSEAENRELFGQWASPYNHGHNYVLDVTTEGRIDAGTGMVVNIKDIDEVLKRQIVSQFDGKSINDEIEHFRTRAASTENIVRYIAKVLGEGGETLTSTPQPPSPSKAQSSLQGKGGFPDRPSLADLPVRLIGLRLEEMPTLWASLEQDGDDWKMTLTRTYEFAASHRLHVPSLSDSTNVELFGKCNNPAGHGHNYIVEVTVSGQPDERTGMIVDLLALDEVVNREVVDRYDHKNLNEDLPEFKDGVTTSEVVVQEIWKRLELTVPATLERVRLHETARNIFEVSR